MELDPKNCMGRICPSLLGSGCQRSSHTQYLGDLMRTNPEAQQRTQERSGTYTHVPKIQATRNTSYLTASKSLNGRKIARMAPILTIFGPNRSRRRDLFFEKFSNERRRHRRLVVVSSSPSSSPSSPPSSPQHNYSRSQLPRTTIKIAPLQGASVV